MLTLDYIKKYVPKMFSSQIYANVGEVYSRYRFIHTICKYTKPAFCEVSGTYADQEPVWLLTIFFLNSCHYNIRDSSDL